MDAEDPAQAIGPLGEARSFLRCRRARALPEGRSECRSPRFGRRTFRDGYQSRRNRRVSQRVYEEVRSTRACPRVVDLVGKPNKENENVRNDVSSPIGLPLCSTPEYFMERSALVVPGGCREARVSADCDVLHDF